MRMACSLYTVTSHHPAEFKNRTFSNKGRGVYLLLLFFHAPFLVIKIKMISIHRTHFARFSILFAILPLGFYGFPFRKKKLHNCRVFSAIIIFTHIQIVLKGFFFPCSNKYLGDNTFRTKLKSPRSPTDMDLKPSLCC